MNWIEATFLGIMVAFGSWMLYVSANRTRTTRIMQNRLVKIADGMWHCALEANQQADETLVKLHNLVIEVAAIAPAIAARVVVPEEDRSITKEDRERLGDFINRNAWVLGYMFAMKMAIDRLEFHAEPWRIDRMKRAIQASILMCLFSAEDGGLRIGSIPIEAGADVEKLGRLNTKEARDTWDRHATAH